jgi:hypothetical protein
VHRSPVLAAALVVLALAAGVARAGDLAAAQRELRYAKMVADSERYQEAESRCERVEHELEGLSPAERAPIDQELAAIRQTVATKQRADDRRTSLEVANRYLGTCESDLEGWNTRDKGAVEMVQGWFAKVEETYGFRTAYALTPEDKAGFAAREARILERAKVVEVDSRVVRAGEKIERIEQMDPTDLYSDSVVDFTKYAEEELSFIPDADPRKAQLRQRLDAALAKFQDTRTKAAGAEKVQAAVDGWAEAKKDFERQNAAWEYEQANDYTHWRELHQVGIDKTARRYEVAAKFLEDERYKTAAQWFATDPAVVALVADVTKARDEAAKKVVATAAHLLDEAEPHAGDDGLADDARALADLVAAHGEGAPDRDAVVARARALAEGHAAAPVPAGQGEASGPEVPSSGGLLKVVLGLVCCFGLLALLAGGALVAWKVVGQQKAPPAPPAA